MEVGTEEVGSQPKGPVYLYLDRYYLRYMRPGSMTSRYEPSGLLLALEREDPSYRITRPRPKLDCRRRTLDMGSLIQAGYLPISATDTYYVLC